MSDIFISYAREDRAEASRLARVLSRQGLSIWWDYNIRFGKQFDEVIQNQLDAAKCVIVIWSKSSVDSRWVREEASHANERGVLLPVLIEAVEPPIGFRSIQAANLIGWSGSSNHHEFKRILQEIADRIGSHPQIENKSKVTEWIINVWEWLLTAKWKISIVGLATILAVVLVIKIPISKPLDRSEQFAKAVDMLQGQGTEVRVAGINTLGEIARDNETDHWKVMDILTAYVRQHALLTSETVLGSPSSPCSRINKDKEIAYVLPEDDVQAVMGVLRNRQWARESADNQKILLESVCLRKVNLSGVYLKRASLQGSDLKGVDLSKSILEDTDLSHTELSRVNLNGANLKGVDLRRAVLSQAQLNGTNLEKASLIAADLRGVDLSQVVGLTQEQVNVARTSKDTKLPAGLHLPVDDE